MDTTTSDKEYMKEPFRGNPSIHGRPSWNEDVIIDDHPAPEPSTTEPAEEEPPSG